MASADKKYKLLAADGTIFESDVPGKLGGNKKLRIYGRLDCPSAVAAVEKGTYQKCRVFFLDEAAAIAAGYRPCGKCMKARYDEWKKGGTPRTSEYPWHELPKEKRG